MLAFRPPKSSSPTTKPATSGLFAATTAARKDGPVSTRRPSPNTPPSLVTSSVRSPLVDDERQRALARSEPPMHWLTPQNRKDGLVVVPRPRPAPCSADDIRRWSDAGINTVVSLLRDDEQRELGLADEGIRCREVGIAFARIPVDDRGLPDSGIDFVQRCLRLHELRAFGATIAVHCRASIGRATLMAVALLVLDGLSPQEALSHVAHARGRDVPDTDEQRQWLLQLPSLVRSVRQLQTW